MYKIGDKVETPLGVGVVTKLSESNVVWVSINLHSLWFEDGDVKPYQSAHDKLIALGLKLKITKDYAGGIFSHEWRNEDNDRIIAFYINEKMTTVYEGSNEIMNVIPQYLKEME